MNNSKTTDNPTPMKDDTFSIKPDVYCFNTLHLTNAPLGVCGDYTVLCSSDPQVATSCCKCKPDCCDQCTSRNSAWDSEYPIVCPAITATENTGVALVVAVLCGLVILWFIGVFMQSFRQQQHQRQPRIQPENRELPKEELQARGEQIPSKFHIRTVQTMDCVRSLIEHKELSRTAGNTGMKENVMADVSLDDDANNTSISSNTRSSDIDAEKGRQPSPVLLLSFETAECSICLEIYRPGDTICVSKAAECDHVFHQACVSEWLTKHDQCPLCRIDLKSEIC
jgi:E3 ubiquitin-protein ligase RNF115/126